MVSSASDVVLVVALVTNGVLAGLFFVFACAVCPGFRHSDDATCVRAFRAINSAILNGWFLTVFFAAPGSAVVGAVLAVVDERPAPAVLLVVAAVCSVLTFAVTAAANVPLNDELSRAVVDDPEGLRVARRRFEVPWTRWNLVRTLTSLGALVALAVVATG